MDDFKSILDTLGGEGKGLHKQAKIYPQSQRCEKYCAIFRVNFGFNYTLFDRIFFITVAASIFMPQMQTNFNAISKNVKILKIGPVEQKL